MKIIKPKGSAIAGSLVELGFSEIEADLYVALLTGGPQTAYTAAKTIGQSPSNIYRTIESLARKGALLVEEGPSKIARAVPVADLVASLEDEFARRARRVERELERIEADVPDPGTYRIDRADQALGRARSVLSSATSIALVDAFPETLEALRPQLADLAVRGVRALVKCYAPAQVPSTATVLTPQADFVMRKWSGQWLTVVADGNEAVFAYFDTGLTTLHQAVWTRSRYVAWAMHGSLASEISLTAVHAAALATPGAPVYAVLENVRDALFGSRLAGDDFIRGLLPEPEV